MICSRKLVFAIFASKSTWGEPAKTTPKLAENPQRFPNFMNIYRLVFRYNILWLFIVLALFACTKILNLSTEGLFLPPPSPKYATASLLTHTFQLLCCVPPLVCGFSYVLLRKINHKNKNNTFILGSALLTGGFLINEIYRIHIIAVYLGIPKAVTITVYALMGVTYASVFKKQILATPYVILLTGVGLLLLAIIVDLLHLSGNNPASLLEGIPKLFSGINVALYFWLVCLLEVLQAWKLQVKK